MATYEYVCLACDRRFEQRRAMTASVDTTLACPCRSTSTPGRRRRPPPVVESAKDVGTVVRLEVPIP